MLGIRLIHNKTDSIFDKSTLKNLDRHYPFIKASKTTAFQV